MMKITKLSLCISMVGVLATLPAAYANDMVTNCAQVSAAGQADTNPTNDASCAKSMIPFDYGDAPDSFKTLDASGGARHQLGTDVYLGACVDGDSGLLQGGASADDTDVGSPVTGTCATPGNDEDGVAIAPLHVGDTKNVVQVTASAACKLNAWVDWNQDGSWGGAGEQVFLNQVLVAGRNDLTMDVPAFAKEGAIYTRFRCSTAGGDDIGGEAADGEVEDYKLNILPAVVKVPVSVGNYIWDDADNNGTQDKGESALAGATVTLLDAAGKPATDIDGKPLAPIITDATGEYLFSNLAEGDYSVTVTAPAGYIATQTGADADVDSNPSNTDNNCSAGASGNATLPFTLTAGGEPDDAADGDDTNGNLTVDCGFYKPKEPTHSLGNRVWIDTNNNGLADVGETPASAGVKLELQDSTGTVLDSKQTDADGRYLFNGLAAGSYTVCVASGNFAKGGILEGYGASTGGNETDANLDVDGNDNGSDDITKGLCSNPIVLDDKEPTLEATATGNDGNDGTGTPDNLSNLTIDFGVVPPTPPTPGKPVAVGNLIWLDSNGNGIQDAGEKGIAGATVTLTDAAGHAANDIDGKPVAAQTTAADGLYKFTNLPEGDFMVTVEPPAGLSLTVGGLDVDADPSDKDSNCRVNAANGTVETAAFTLAAGTEPDTAADGDGTDGNMTVDCGFTSLAPPPPPPPPTGDKVVGLGSRLWIDLDGNGKQNGGEPGIPGATVTLLDASGKPATDFFGKPVPPQTTDADGKYFFGDLRDGSYLVKVTPPAGYLLTTPVSDPNNNDPTDSNGTVAADGSVISQPIDLKWGTEPDNGGAANLTVGFGFVPNLHVPTLSQWGTVIMSLLLATVAWFRRRRED